MSVYVDPAVHPFGRMVMCHMIADTPEELRAAAVKIGVQLKWFQSRASHPHFDICKSKRALAVAAGAVEVSARDLALKAIELRQIWPRDARGWRI